MVLPYLDCRRTIRILSRRTKNNPVLVGEAGVGKTAIVEGMQLTPVEDADFNSNFNYLDIVLQALPRGLY